MRAQRAKKRIYAHPKNCAKIYRFTVHFLYVWLCVWLNVNVSKTSAFFKTSYFVIIVLWQGRKISSMYRGTKQNCCKYLRLLPSRILIGSTCIIHSLVHWSFGDFWFIEKKEEKDEYVFNSNRYFALSHCRMPNSINNSLESINLHNILSRRILIWRLSMCKILFCTIT